MTPCFTLGVEEEYSIVDAATGELRPRADRLVPRAQQLLGDEEVQGELNLSQIEVGTPVCSTLAEVRDELVRLRRQVLAAAEREGSKVVSTGSHPTGQWREQPINYTKDRYRMLEEEFRLTAREQLVSGCHVHVGIEDPHLAIAVLDRTRRWLHPLLALSANSPFWMGLDSGYASFRSQIWGQWPMSGMPEPLLSRDRYDELVEDLVATGVIPDGTFIYWDVRPSTRYETLEFRVADACLTVDEAVMVAGMVRALAETCATEAEAGEQAPPVRGEVLLAAKWRAARFGLDSTLVDLSSGRPAPGGPVAAADVVARLLAYLRPALERHGDWEEVEALVERTVSGGNGARRQRDAFARNGNLQDVIDLLVRETAAGVT